MLKQKILNVINYIEENAEKMVKNTEELMNLGLCIDNSDDKNLIINYPLFTACFNKTTKKIEYYPIINSLTNVILSEKQIIAYINNLDDETLYKLME